MRAVAAGAAYFLILFSAGFVLGALRVSVIAPRLGETAAVFLELPIMLTVSWLACRSLIRRMRVSADWTSRALMGSTGFFLLMLAEIALGLFGFDKTLRMQLAALIQPAGLIGLAGQIVFGMIPLLQTRAATNPAMRKP